MSDTQADLGRGSGSCWGALALDTPESLEPTLVGCLSHVCLGAEFRETDPGQGQLTVYLGSQAEARDAALTVAQVLERNGLDPDKCRLRVERIEDGRWVERYQASLRPFPLGRRFRVVPGGGGAGADIRVAGRRSITLVPGRAFGTGEHPTTRMCVRQLEGQVVAESRWLDLGCGSGILSLVARFCGARRVVALDVDSVAAEVARLVIRKNGEERAIEVVAGSSDSVRHGVWDGVVANIAASHFVHSGASTAALLRPGGVLIASGFSAQPAERAEVLDALTRAGLVEIGDDSCEGWSTLVLARDPA